MYYSRKLDPKVNQAIETELFSEKCNDDKHKNSRILQEVHETASGLHGAGLIDKRRMREFDVLCHLDVHEMPPENIKRLREEAHVSQAVFAAVLNTSVPTVQKWEVGDKRPSGPSLKILNLVEQRGLDGVL